MQISESVYAGVRRMAGVTIKVEGTWADANSAFAAKVNLA